MIAKASPCPPRRSILTACTSRPNTTFRSPSCAASELLDRERDSILDRAMKARKQQDEFIARCRRAGLSVTHQRLAIFEAVMANGELHPSAEVIYHSVRERYPTISFNTIYKNLETFEALGIVVKVNPLYRSEERR